MNQELNNSRVTTHGSTTAQLLCRVENERDDARLEVQQLRSECHSLRERLKIAKESKEREREEDQSKVTTLQVELETVMQKWVWLAYISCCRCARRGRTFRTEWHH